MALKFGTGISNVFVYGTQPVFEFTVRFPSPSMTSGTPLNTQHPLRATNYPTPGDILVAGIPVTLGVDDLFSPKAVTSAIKAESITDYTVAIDAYNPALVRLISDTIGPLDAADFPTVELDTAENLLFINKQYIQGVECSAGDQDDIYIGGGSPIILTLQITSAVGTEVFAATGTLAEQEAGTLAYGSALVFTDGICVLSTPVTFVKVVTDGVSSASQVKLHINR